MHYYYCFVQSNLIYIYPIIYHFLPPFQFSSVAQSCPTFCDTMDCSTPGLPVHHQLLEFTQTHVHWVGDAIRPSYSPRVPFSSCPQSFLASKSFPMSWLFISGGKNIYKHINILIIVSSLASENKTQKLKCRSSLLLLLLSHFIRVRLCAIP